MSTLAMIILLNFNLKLTYSVKELEEATNLGGDVLVRILNSLSLGKYKILKKEGDVYSFDSGFKCGLAKFRIAAVSVNLCRESEEEQINDAVESQRKYQIEACIIRTMKARKEMEHGQLVVEVISQMDKQFRADGNMIKRRVETLIEREYLERDAERVNVYRYCA